MRPIYLVRLDKTRPAVVLTRESVRPRLRKVTVAPVTSRVLGLATEVPVGRMNGLDEESVISCDNLLTIPADELGRVVGYLLAEQEPLLARAIMHAFNLELEPR